MPSITSATVDARNAATSRQEVEAFIAEKPDRYFAYWQHGRLGRGANTGPRLSYSSEIATWTGDKLADVISFGTPYFSNMGDKRQSFRAQGINGCTYSGTAYLSAGDYVRMRKVKS